MKSRIVHREAPHGHHVVRKDTLRTHRVAGRVRAGNIGKAAIMVMDMRRHERVPREAERPGQRTRGKRRKVETGEKRNRASRTVPMLLLSVAVEVKTSSCACWVRAAEAGGQVLLVAARAAEARPGIPGALRMACKCVSWSITAKLRKAGRKSSQRGRR